MGMLDELLGGGQTQKEYQDFVNRYEQGDPSEGYSTSDRRNASCASPAPTTR